MSLLDVQGWIPYIDRTREQQHATDAFHEQVSTASSVIAMRPYADLPDLVYHPAMCKKATGKPMYRSWQVTGSCVGSGSSVAQYIAGCGDIVHRNTREEVRIPWWLATYGKGREIAGMGSKGSGSFGAANAQACQQFGTLSVNNEVLNLPQPELVSEVWYRFTKAQEIGWSLPPWPIDEYDVGVESAKHQIQTVKRISTKEELVNVLAQGYGCTVASSFGSRRMRMEHGVLMAPYDSSWAHQMTVLGYWRHEDLGLIMFIANQWGPNAHPRCDFQAGKHGVTGAFAVNERVIDYMLGQELYAHSDTEGWPLRDIAWDDWIWNVSFGDEEPQQPQQPQPPRSITMRADPGRYN